MIDFTLPQSKRGGIRTFAAALARHEPRSLVCAVLVLMAAAASQGLAIALLVPVLETAGIGNAASPQGPGGAFQSVLDALGVPVGLRSMLVLYVVIVACAALLAAYRDVLLARYRLEFTDALRSRLYTALAKAEWRHLLRLRQSDLLSALTMNVNWVSVATLSALSLCATAVLVVVQLAIAVRISPAVTALAAATGAALIALMWPLALRSRRLGHRLVDNNRGLLASITGFLDGLKIAKAHGLEGRHVALFEEEIRRTRELQVDFTRASAASTAVQLTLTAVVLALLVGFAIERLQLAIAPLLVLAFIFSRLVPQFTSAQRQVQQIAHALPAFDELNAVIEGCEGARERVSAGRTPKAQIGQGIVLERVSFSYSPESSPALRDVSLEIPAGCLTALAGPSGSGKTTLSDIVAGLLEPTEGRVLAGGRVRTAEELREWRSRIALVPQEPFLFHDTIAANLRWARPGATDTQLWQVLETAAAKEFVAALPEGLETVVGDRGGRLSGGERQRLALARALLRAPQLLILDEATNALDDDNELAIGSALATLRGQCTVLLIAHRLSTVSRADAVVVLEAGRVFETGSWAELSGDRGGRLPTLREAGPGQRAKKQS